jgi:hypothetical protein
MKKKIEGQEMETPGKAIYNLRSFQVFAADNV